MRSLLLVIYLGVHFVAVITPARNPFFIGDEMGRDWVTISREYADAREQAEAQSPPRPDPEFLMAQRSRLLERHQARVKGL
jgi:hypothetical protein